MEEKDYNKKSGNKLNIINFGKKKKYKITRKQVAITITSGILALLIAISSATIGRKVEIDKSNQQIIERFYDAEELEQRVNIYLGISKTLNNLNLNKYEVNDNLFVEYGISNELKSPEQINEMIAQFKSPINSFDKYNLIRNNEVMKLILNLKQQEKLVNQFIYDTGYDVAHYNITKATKEMAAEVFGLDPNNISFRYDNNDGNEVNIVYMDVIDPSTGIKKTYRIKNNIFNGIEDQIIDGVKMMVDTDVDLDKDNSDNGEFNKERNKRIEEAIEKSALMFDKVDNENLYNEDLNEDFGKKSNRLY